MGKGSSWDSLVRLMLCGSLILSSAAPLSADETTTITTGTTLFDSYLQQDAAATNNGNAATMFVQSRNNGTARNRRAVVEWDLTASGIPATAAVKIANMKLTLSVAPTPAQGSRNHEAHVLTGAPNWTGTTVTWNNRTGGSPWTTAGGDFHAASASTQATGTTNNAVITWPLLSDGTTTNIGQQWLSTPASNLGILIKDSVEDAPVAGVAGQYVTQNGAPAAAFPALEMHYLRDVNLNAPTLGISNVTWTWTFPAGSTGANYNGVLFVKKPGSGAAFTFAPADGTAYTVGTSLGNSEDVVINSAAFATVTSTDENGADSVVLPGTAYTYKTFNHDNTNITNAASVTPPHYALGTTAGAFSNATTTTGGGANKNWSYLTGAATLSPPGLDPGNIVLAGSNDSKLHTMSAANGGRKYRPAAGAGLTGGAIQSRPILIPSIVSSTGSDVAYVGSADGTVWAINPSTGATIWQSAVLGNAIFGSPGVQLKAYSAASYPHAFDLVIVGTRNGSTTNNKVYGLNGNTGAIIWTFSPGNMDIVSSSPAVDYATNSVWVASWSGAAFTQPSLWKLNTATVNPAGNLLNSVVLSTLALSTIRDIDMSPDYDPTTAYLFAITRQGTLVVVDHVTPTNVFTQAGAGSGLGFPTIFPGGAANEDDVYYTTSGATGGVHKRTFNRVTHAFTTRWDDTVAALTGSGAGTVSAPVMITPTPTAAMYVGTSDGMLKSLNLSTGAILATRTVNAGIIIGDPSLDVISGKIYVGDSSGRIYSFDTF